MQLSRIIRDLGRATQRNSPAIMTGLGVTGLVTTVVLAIKATITAQEELLELSFNEQENVFFENGLKDRVRLTWQLYIPTVASLALTATCIIWANKVSAGRTAAIASAYTLLEKSSDIYQTKVLEHVEPKTRDKIDQAVAKEVLPKTAAPTVMPAGTDTRFYEAVTGRYFWSDMESVRKAENDANHELMGDVWISLNRLYDYFGMESTQVGDWLGWSVGEKIDLKFHAVIDDDGRPTIVVQYGTQPEMYAK